MKPWRNHAMADRFIGSGVGYFAQPQMNQPTHREHIGMFRIGPQNLAVEPCGFAKFAALVLAVRVVQQEIVHAHSNRPRPRLRGADRCRPHSRQGRARCRSSRNRIERF
jgi:hypothetical protein